MSGDRDSVSRFLLENLDISGTLVRIGPVWRQMLAGRDYPANIVQLLGEMTATTLLLGDKLKQPGRLTTQLRGSGPLSLLVIDCSERLQLRGMARCQDVPAEGTIRELLGQGQLLLSLELAAMREPYQSIVPLEGETIGEIFEHYTRRSEQHAARLMLAASPTAAAGLLLQKLPDADLRDADGWTRVDALATTISTTELLDLPAEDLLQRVFHEETVCLFPARAVEYNCPEDWEKVRAMLRALGRDEVYAALHERGEILIRDDICNREYRFDAMAIAELFADSVTPSPTVH